MAILDLRVRSPYDPKKADWHKVVVYGPLAEHCGRHLRKGMMIQLDGVLTTSRWKDGDKFRKAVQVVAQSISLGFHRNATERLEVALLLAGQQGDDVEVEED